jgi:endopolyphosphatase
MVADKFVDTFSKHGQLTVPIIPTFGNNDFLPHNIFYPGPNKWLKAYAHIWKRFIPEAQRHSFEFGGWFWVEVVPNHLAVFSLNTMYFFDRNAGVDGCAEPSEPGFAHMEWLRIQLQLLRDRGMKAILTGHVPPARTMSKQNWDETCWQKYTLWLKQYRDVVTGSLYGHMNIDHFTIQDTNDIDIALGVDENHRRGALSLESEDDTDEELSITSKDDYLQGLRADWADLPGSAIKALFNTAKKHKSGKKKGDKFKKIGGKYAERYQVSLISPSIVPNYFPTIRVFEYNITGVEKSPAWTESLEMKGVVPSLPEPIDEFEQELQDEIEAFKKKNKKKHKKKPKKPKKPKDPNLILPKDPPSGSTPGPAYCPQKFTLTGYTQYFANLTYLNNDIEDPDFEDNRWRDGDHADDKPKNKKPQPHDFNFEVEYSTFDDGKFKLKDLTVRQYLKLAYRISRLTPGKGKQTGRSIFDLWQSLFGEDESSATFFDEEFDEDFRDDDDEEYDIEDGEGEDWEDDYESAQDVSQAKKGHKKKGDKNKGNKKPRTNKSWITFLSRAFVSTVPTDELEKM